MSKSVDINDTLIAALRNDKNLSGSDEDRVSQALRAYLRAQAGRGLITAGGQAPDMQDIPRH